VTRTRVFLGLWLLAVVAATSAFVLYLALRVRSVEIGYELGRVHSQLARLREVKRVLELELATQKNPERVEFVARSLFDMDQPEPSRQLAAGPRPLDESASEDGQEEAP
jgi:cell division protein FtsL